MKICVVNASQPSFPHMNDSYVNFEEYDSWEDAKWRSWHSIPASLQTEFFAYNGDNFHKVYQYDGIILLVNESPIELMPFVKKLKTMGKIVVVGYHEGFGDIMTKLGHPSYDVWFRELKELVTESNAYWNVIPSASSVFLSLFRKPVLNVLHGVPLNEWDHGLIKPIEEREGIFVATRTFDQRLGRNHIAALAVADLAAHMLQTHVTCITEQPVPDIVKNFERVQILQGPLSYMKWLDVMSQHRVVFHYDCSHTLGQVAMDALLVDVPCLGGNSENNIESKTAFHLRNLEGSLVHYYEQPEIDQEFKKKMSFEYLSKYVLGSFQALEAAKIAHDALQPKGDKDEIVV